MDTKRAWWEAIKKSDYVEVPTKFSDFRRDSRGYFPLTEDRFWDVVKAQTLGEGPLVARRREIERRLVEWGAQGRLTLDRAARLFAEMYFIALMQGDRMASGYDMRDVVREANHHATLDAILWVEWHASRQDQ